MKRLIVPLVVLLISMSILSGCNSTSTITPAPAITTSSTPPTTTTSSLPTTITPTVAASTDATPVAIATSTPLSNINRGGILRVVDSNTPGTPIGWPAETAGPSVITMQLSLEPLLKEQLGGTIEPRLATSYDIDTGTVDPSVTFHLRKGVKFQDGTDFNAQAVKWNLAAIKAGGMTATGTVIWKEFEVIDDYTLKIHVTNWMNKIIRSFADSLSYMVSPTAYQKNGVEWMRWHMVGTGPFIQTDFQRDTVTKATKNTNYWLTGHPYLDEVDYIYVPDEMTREALFKSGGADIMTCTPRIGSDLQASGFKILTKKEGPAALIPDSANADSPWSNPKVRIAAEYAIDREAMAKAFGYGFITAAYQVPSSASIGYDSALESKYRKYDIVKAKQLMADAGYANGFKTTIYAQSGTPQDTIVALQAYLGKIGITCDLQFPEAAQMNKYLNGGPWHNALLYTQIMEWANYTTTYVNFFSPEANWYQSLKKPDEMWKLIQATLITPVQDQGLLQKVTDWLFNDVTIIPLTYGTSLWSINDKVQDSGFSTRGAQTYWNPENAWLSK